MHHNLHEFILQLVIGIPAGIALLAIVFATADWLANGGKWNAKKLK